MKYILDSCTAFKWFLAEQDSDKARSLREDFRNQKVDLLAPDIFPVEIVHALTRAERAQRITPSEGTILVSALFKMLPVLVQSLPLLPRAYELSSRFRIGVYDCLYVALAEQEACDLVTADEKLITNLPGFPIRSLTSL
jgi:predicted nucleic acid-binding protein